MAAQSKVFIDVEVDASVAGDAAVAAKLEEVCPVDIFKDADGHVQVVDDPLACRRSPQPGDGREKNDR